MTISRPARALVLAALSALVAPHDAAAQERIEVLTYVNGQYRVVEMDATVSRFGEVRRITPIAAEVIPGDSNQFMTQAPSMAALPGGRYLVWTRGRGILAFDRLARRVVDASTVAGLPPAFGPAGDLTLLGVDSRRPRVFVQENRFRDGNVLWALDLAGAPPVQLAVQPYLFTGVAYAADADLLFYPAVDFEDGMRVTWVVAVRASSGQEVRRWKIGGFVTTLHVTSDATALWTDSGGLTAHDPATGAAIASSSRFSATQAWYDAERRLLFVRQGDFLVVLDPRSLAEIGRTRVAYNPPDPVIARTDQSLPGRWMTGAYTVRSETRVTLLRSGRVGREDIVEKTCNAIFVDAIAPDGRRRDTADILTPLGPGGGQIGEQGSVPNCSAVGVLVRSPFAPASLAASTSGATVTLAWADPGDASGFELEYGVVPGQRAGSLRLPAGTTQFAIPGVPPGVYYVRVKAFNAVGTGPASSEVRVTVP